MQRSVVQLSDRDFFLQVSVGLGHVINNAVRLANDAQLLAEQERPQGCLILSEAAEEEAAKLLILIDAVRCPRKPPEILTRQLARFNDHLAKGLYAKACYWRPTTFAEFLNYIDRDRQEFYLDGPNDMDWIFRNRILANREETIYVDYVETDDGHLWLTPGPDAFLLSYTPAALRLSQALSDAGCTTAEALEFIAEFWRPITMAADYRWVDLRKLNHETLMQLEARNLLREQPQETYTTIVDLWPFPMFSLDLQLAPVDKNGLREIQKRWTPDW